MDADVVTRLLCSVPPGADPEGFAHRIQDRFDGLDAVRAELEGVAGNPPVAELVVEHGENRIRTVFIEDMLSRSPQLVRLGEEELGHRWAADVAAGAYEPADPADVQAQGV